MVAAAGALRGRRLVRSPDRASQSIVIAVVAAVNVMLAVLVAHGSVAAACALAGLGVAVTLAAVAERTLLYALLFANMLTSFLFAFVSEPVLALPGMRVYPQDVLVFLVVLPAVLASLERAASPTAVPDGGMLYEPITLAFLPLGAAALIGIARGGVNSLSSARLFAYAVLAVGVVHAVRTQAHLRTLVRVIVAGGSIGSILGLAYLATGTSITGHDLSTGGVRGVAIGTSYLIAAALLAVIADRIVDGGAFGASWPFLIPLLTGGVIASGARETWLGLIGALVVFVVVSPVRSTVRVASTIIGASIVVLVAYSLLPSGRAATVDRTLVDAEQRLVSIAQGRNSSDFSAQDRLIKWRVVWGEVRRQPVFGTGLGTTFTYTTNFGGANFVRHVADDPENTHLWVWARLGTVGFASWVLLNLVAFGALVRRSVLASSAFARGAALWGSGTMVVLWAGMAFSPVTAFRATLVFFWLVLALVPVLRRLDLPRGAETPV